MAYPTIIKKRLALYIEDTSSIGTFILYLHARFLSLVMTYLHNAIKVSGKKYPISERELRRALYLEKVNGYWVIGLRTEGVHVVDQETFNKVLDVEYGSSGKEVRVITRALENIIQYVRRESPNVSVIL